MSRPENRQLLFNLTCGYFTMHNQAILFLGLAPGFLSSLYLGVSFAIGSWFADVVNRVGTPHLGAKACVAGPGHSSLISAPLRFISTLCDLTEPRLKGCECLNASCSYKLLLFTIFPGLQVAPHLCMVVHTKSCHIAHLSKSHFVWLVLRCESGRVPQHF